MYAIRDGYGRLWAGRLDTAAALRLRDLAGLDLMALAADAAGFARAAAGTVRLVDAAYAILLPLCDRRGVDDRQFGRRLRGPWWRRQGPSSLGVELVAAVRDYFAVPKLSPGKKGDTRKPDVIELWGDVHRLAGIAGVDPGPHTFGELVALADARRKHDWSMTACLLAAQGDGKTTAADLDPTGGLSSAPRSGGIEIDGDGIALMAALFCG